MTASPSRKNPLLVHGLSNSAKPTMVTLLAWPLRRWSGFLFTRHRARDERRQRIEFGFTGHRVEGRPRQRPDGALTPRRPDALRRPVKGHERSRVNGASADSIGPVSRPSVATVLRHRRVLVPRSRAGWIKHLYDAARCSFHARTSSVCASPQRRSTCLSWRTASSPRWRTCSQSRHPSSASPARQKIRWNAASGSSAARGLRGAAILPASSSARSEVCLPDACNKAACVNPFPDTAVVILSRLTAWPQSRREVICLVT